ncbi:MAG: 50S ribosomal protein L6 [Syntrophales bacterium]|nr:50S ribosomal protein L6 [Syntrophales bacterium]
MSRIGKKPIELPPGVQVTRQNGCIKVAGPKGTLHYNIPRGIEVRQEDNKLVVECVTSDRKGKALHGLARTLIANMVTGVTVGYEKALEISGVGYRAELGQGVLKLSLGYSHPIEYRIPEGISIRIDRQVNIVVSGIDKELVGRVAAEIRAFKEPEPYKGKGIKYVGEKIIRKAGKTAGSR